MSNIGQIVDESIQNIDKIYDTVSVNKYIVMPNHIHMLLTIDAGRAIRAPTISTVINQFKGSVSKRVGYSIWQKLFYDHIIRDKNDYQTKWDYIGTSIARWEEDEYYEKQKYTIPAKNDEV